jgi:DNA-binding CsgD family transcriptional regulator
MLLGRELERQEIQRVLSQARCGESTTVALVGEPGIGKSALLEHTAEQAAAMQLLRARGIESEARIPFASLLELLRPVLEYLDVIPEPQAAALAAALALRPRGSHERFAIGAATLSLLAAAAESDPLLLLVDDAHWLDPPSAEALLFALRRMSVDPIGAVIAVREGEPSLVEGADLPLLRLKGLSMREARQLLPGLPSAVLSGLHTATQGNPLAMIELSREPDRLVLSAQGVPIPLPERIAGAFSRRVARLPERTRLALGFLAASDAGDLAALERPARRLGVDLGALAGAERAGLIFLSGGRASFRHPLVRASAYGAMAAEQLRDIHRALAATLPDRDLDRRAWHLAVAAVGYDEPASTALEHAALRSRERSAHATASAAFERAARLAGDAQRRARLLLEAGRAAWDAGLGARASELLQELRGIPAGETVRVEADELAGHISVQQGPIMRGHAILVAAAESADSERAVALLAEATAACFYAGEVRSMLKASRRAVERLAPDASDRARFLAAAAHGIAETVGGDAGAGAASIRSALDLALRAPELDQDTQLLPWLVVTPIFLRESEAGRELLKRALQQARAQAALGALPFVLNLIGRDYATTDRWSEAEAIYQEAATLARETGQRTELPFSLSGLACLYARRGLEAAARGTAQEALELSRALGTRLFELWALAALGDLELGLGHAAEAIRQLEERERLLDQLGISDPDVSAVPELVEALVRLERVAEAIPLAARIERSARVKGQPWSLARAARCRALVGPCAEMERGFERALDHHAQTADQFERARTLLLYGERLRRMRERRRARVQLRQALEIFERLEATPWAERARGELAASGETLRRRDPSSLDDLTPQELQVALLLASGKTTREAGAALFISPKTVEYHLRHVYLKLGVHSREQLAKAMDTGRDGPPGPSGR